MQEMRAGSIPETGRPSGGGNGNPLQFSCLGNPRDRGAWPVAVHGAAKSRPWLSNLNTHTLRVLTRGGSPSWGPYTPTWPPLHISAPRALPQTGLLKDSLTPHAHQVISHSTILIFFNPYYQKYSLLIFLTCEVNHSHSDCVLHESRGSNHHTRQGHQLRCSLIKHTPSEPGDAWTEWSHVERLLW